MKHASTLKNATALRALTELHVVKKNATHWSSTYFRLKQYFQIESELKEVESLIEYLPSAMQQA